MVTDTFAIAEV